MNNKLTKKQHELLTFIDEYIKDHGYSPTYREIMSGLNYKSVATVAKHVNNLVALNRLEKIDNSARTLEIKSDSFRNNISEEEKLIKDFLERKKTEMKNEKREKEAEILTETLKILFGA